MMVADLIARAHRAETLTREELIALVRDLGVLADQRNIALCDAEERLDELQTKSGGLRLDMEEAARDAADDAKALRAIAATQMRTAKMLLKKARRQ